MRALVEDISEEGKEEKKRKQGGGKEKKMQRYPPAPHSKEKNSRVCVGHELPALGVW